jgi:hypothetical protein
MEKSSLPLFYGSSRHKRQWGCSQEESYGPLLGNLLIVQEPSSRCLDDNVDEGMIVFYFVSPAEIVYAMGFLTNAKCLSKIIVKHLTEEGERDTVFETPVSDNNHNRKETLRINIGAVLQSM